MPARRAEPGPVDNETGAELQDPEADGDRDYVKVHRQVIEQLEGTCAQRSRVIAQRGIKSTSQSTADTEDDRTAEEQRSQPLEARQIPEEGPQVPEEEKPEHDGQDRE